MEFTNGDRYINLVVIAHLPCHIDGLMQMGFGLKWCNWVDACLRSASISILVNGSPTEEFRMTRGIRQGDLLSPFLFLIAAEGINVATKEAISNGVLKGVSIGREVTVSHLQYADDTVFFGEWSQRNGRNLMGVIKCFEKAPGLKLNLSKSSLYGVGVPQQEVDAMASFLSETVILWWSANFGGVKYWEPKASNLGLLGKWWWRFKFKGNPLWVRVIKSIYGDGGLRDGGDRVVNSRGTWSSIIKVGKEIDRLGIEFTSSFGRKLGNGESIRFWVDKWVGNYKLCDQFPRLFRLERNKEVHVGDRGCWDHNGWNWCWDWVANPRGRSSGELEDCISLVRDHVPSRDGTDSWQWMLEDGGFSVKVLKEMVDEKVLGPRSQVEETKWCRIVPRKVNVYMWRLKCGRIPVRTLLDNIGMDLHSNLCPHCSFVASSVQDVLNLAGFGPSKLRLYWEAVIWASLYLIWNARNNKVFRDKEMSATDLVFEIQLTSFFWVSHSFFLSSCGVLQVIERTLSCDIENDLLLNSKSFFPYFMLVAFEGGSIYILRACFLLSCYPLLVILNRDLRLRLMILITFCGMKVKDVELVGRTVLVKIYLENLNLEVYELVSSMKEARTKVAVLTSVPRSKLASSLIIWRKKD
nr:glycerol-3-phosphate acyltransferase 1 [Tanacetum cinerariifolium]